MAAVEGETVAAQRRKDTQRVTKVTDRLDPEVLAGELPRPGFELGSNRTRDFLERHEGLGAMLADQTGFADVAAEQRERGRAATGRVRISARWSGQPL